MLSRVSYSNLEINDRRTPFHCSSLLLEVHNKNKVIIRAGHHVQASHQVRQRCISGEAALVLRLLKQVMYGRGPHYGE